MIPDLKILPVSHPVDGSSALCLTPCPSQEGGEGKEGEGGGRKWRQKERGISFAVSLLINSSCCFYYRCSWCSACSECLEARFVLTVCLCQSLCLAVV